MNVRKFKIICDGRFRGFIFISDYQGNYACKTGTIAPFELRVDDNGDTEFIGLDHIIDLYLPETLDDDIKTNLLRRVNFNNCTKLDLLPI